MVEIVTDNETGLLLPPGDTAAWHDALASLAENDARRAAMGKSARHRAQAEFTWDANARKLENLLTQGTP
jgi:glycosyltransferase involved in cell wall biosynthesis